MACYHPLTGYRARTPNPSGKYSLVFNRNEGYIDQEITVPCGGCIGCRLEYSRQWAVRCLHEASLYENNVFLTLTYNDENLPTETDDGIPAPKTSTLRKSDFQKFMKRLRKRYGNTNGGPIRYFHCGEYGEKKSRPHYHALIFNFDFSDKYLWRLSPCKSYQIFRSKELEKLWPYGFCEIGSVTYQSAAYVARYVIKKHKGKDSFKHYSDYDESTGQVLFERIPEYVTMSRRPGIGKGWLEKYENDVYPHDSVVIDGSEWKPPRYYDNQLEEDEFFKIKCKRKALGETDAAKYNSTINRRLVRENIKKQKLKLLERKL